MKRGLDRGSSSSSSSGTKLSSGSGGERAQSGGLACKYAFRTGLKERPQERKMQGQIPSLVRHRRGLRVLRKQRLHDLWRGRVPRGH
jgi:hypothetical protein